MPEWIHRGGHLKKQKRDDAMSSLFFAKKSPHLFAVRAVAIGAGKFLLDQLAGGGGGVVVRLSCSLSRNHPATISSRPHAPQNDVTIEARASKTTIATPSINIMPGMRPVAAKSKIFFMIGFLRFLRGTDSRCAPRLSIIKCIIKKSPPQNQSAVGVGIYYFLSLIRNTSLINS